MIENLKNRMRLAADLHDWIELNGCEVVVIEFANYRDDQVMLQVNLGEDHANANGLNRLSDEANEAAALLILNADPTLKLRRSSALIYLDGERNGLTFELYFGSGSCKRVQVGTRKVMVPDPAVPLIEIEEPIFETVCE